MTGALLIPILTAIKLDNPRAIFFKETRCGWLEKCFRIIKFRFIIYKCRSPRT
ncbi:MAG: sugar transferase [cyanobacterium endosymbiont of Rhopalodia sterrenbergii]